MGAILQFPQFIDGVPVVAGNPGQGRAAQIHAVMVGPDPLLVAFDEDAVRPGRRVSIQPSRFNAASIRAAFAMPRP
jgi:hypothetical protein